MSDLVRLPGESLLAFYNRRLDAKGVRNKRWRQRRDGSMYLEDVYDGQKGMDFGGRP